MTREEAIQTLTTIDSGYSPNFVANGHIAIGMAIKALGQEPQTMHWQKHTDTSGNSWHTCPACGHIAYTLSHYCPDCGMRLEAPS